MKFLLKTFKVALVLALAFVLSGATTAIAAGVTLVSDTMTRQKVSVASDHVIKFTSPTGVAAGSTVTLTFPTQNSQATAGTFDFTGLSTSDVTVSGFTPASVAFAIAPTVGPAAVANNQIILTNGASAVAGPVAITVTIGGNKLVNPAVSGSWKVAIAGSFGDIGAFAVPTYDEDTVRITAEVDPYINFEIVNTTAASSAAITDYTVDFGVLSSGGAKYAKQGTLSGGYTTESAAHGLKVDTNATSGYVISVINGNPTNQPTGALTSAAGDTISPIGAAAASVPGSEQFGMRATAASCVAVGCVAPSFATSSYGTANYAGGNETASVEVAKNTSPTTFNYYDVYYIANIAATTESGNYETSRIFTATGQF